MKVSITEEEKKDAKKQPYTKPEFTVALNETFEFSAMSDDGIPDMVEIDELNAATLLYNLSTRYEREDIYTYVGPILLVLNPFKALPHLGTEECRNQYVQIALCSGSPLSLKKELPPHTYALAAQAYWALQS